MATVTTPSARTTSFLPAERASGDQLGSQVARVASNAVVDSLLHSWGGALAILNDQRQVVALNGAYLNAVGATSPLDALGLRPGEALRCVHASSAPGGCGTARACPTCGAAAAIVAASARAMPEERDCSLTVERDGEVHDYDLRVRAAPLDLGDETFTLLTFRDVSAERRRASLERIFFHDLTNLVTSLRGAARALPDAVRPEDAVAVDDVRTLADRLVRELQVQRALSSDQTVALHASSQEVELAQVVDQADRLFRHHPAATGKALLISMAEPSPAIETDPDLLQRVLTNLLINAFEATVPGGTVRLSVEPTGGGGVALRVWNPSAIPAAVLPRVFQRYFSTKPGEGRGQGTFVARLFTERYLRGTISVASSAEGGTAFEVRLPRSLRR
jgi:signal transduction histidine kinase